MLLAGSRLFEAFFNLLKNITLLSKKVYFLISLQELKIEKQNKLSENPMVNVDATDHLAFLACLALYTF